MPLRVRGRVLGVLNLGCGYGHAQTLSVLLSSGLSSHLHNRVVVRPDDLLNLLDVGPKELLATIDLV
jgi:hypothetical protein